MSKRSQNENGRNSVAATGSKGERFYQWAFAPFGMPTEKGFRNGLLVRCSLKDPEELAYYFTHAPAGTSLKKLVQIAGSRWAVEECFEQVKQETGLDEDVINQWEHDNAIRNIRLLGRKGWKQEVGYHRRSLAETAMFRLKKTSGDKLKNRKLANQMTEAALRCKILNLFVTLGMLTFFWTYVTRQGPFVIVKPVLTTSDAILQLCQEVNNRHECLSLVTWIHTFSPAKMWIAGLNELKKPHLHTQLNREVSWSTIDMDFINTNQAAHGGREFGFLCSRMRLSRKVVVGHWQDVAVQQQLGVWTRAAAARADWRSARIARIGDNMRKVAVTESDKVEAQLQFGYSVNGYGLENIIAHVDDVFDSSVDELCGEYEQSYEMAIELQSGGDRHKLLCDAARIELGLRLFLTGGGFVGLTDTFENLHGFKQLPASRSRG